MLWGTVGCIRWWFGSEDGDGGLPPPTSSSRPPAVDDEVPKPSVVVAATTAAGATAFVKEAVVNSLSFFSAYWVLVGFDNSPSQAQLLLIDNVLVLAILQDRTVIH